MSQINLSLLRESALFADMSDAEIASLAELFRGKSILAGKTVFIENMPGESLYLVKEGTIRISKMLAEGDEQTLVVLGPDDTFGEMAVLDVAPRSATARVIEDAHLLSICKNDFEELCDSYPALGLKLMRNIIRIFSKRIRESSEEYRDMLIWSLGRKD
ncbi:cyclic nucleotide-binding domain-containing protein [Trichloromonas sp.]|uniref:cyclic nucleotide-binding domain-containing protein n=1 Tax=Trichloromonas sp. TaxID=3069249 RepID=UPI003D81B816